MIFFLILLPFNIRDGQNCLFDTGKEGSLFKTGNRVFGFCEFGAHAEYISVAEQDTVATIPGDMTFEEAAPLTEGSHHALNYIRRALIQAGQHVLVYGATGAIGSAALQIIKYIGAEVSAVCNIRNMDLMKSLGPTGSLTTPPKILPKQTRSMMWYLMQ